MMFLHKMIELLLSRRRRERPVVTPSAEPFPEIPFVEPPPPAHAYLYNEPGDIYKDTFYSNLVKTIAWTEKIIAAIPDQSAIDYLRVLRSTNPVYNGRPFYSYGAESRYGYAATPEIYFDYSLVLNEALLIRHDTIGAMDEPANYGKILVFEIDVTTHDGVPIVVSDGFVDESDIPPIDTWFFITKQYLYCWIPTLFIAKMQLAIDVEMFGSYGWLELVNPSLNEQLLDRLKK